LTLGPTPDLHKFPRTPHLAGSRLQPGDDDVGLIPFDDIANRLCVVSEKVDGANSAISFDEDGSLRLQSRGHFLTGGPRERQFNLFHAWASTHQVQLRARLSSRYVLYGEWMYAKQTIYYDALPHYFLAFDDLDTQEGSYLSTQRREDLLTGPPLASVPLLSRGTIRSPEDLHALLGPSRDRMMMEGLYIKVEDTDHVLARYKYVRPTFRATIQSGDHWLNRPIIPNRLLDGVGIFDL
jgi:RNA ligase